MAPRAKKKWKNYLLEEGDDREERTGYLYMEFKRMKSEEYMTLGLGIRARKNKKLESWYFLYYRQPTGWKRCFSV